MCMKKKPAIHVHVDKFVAKDYLDVYTIVILKDYYLLTRK